MKQKLDDPLLLEALSARPFLEEVANKWTVLVLTLLCAEPRRFSVLRRGLGVTQKALTETLRRLERNGLVTRRVLETSPIAVEYSLTPLGRSLQQPFAAVYAWTLNNVAAMEEAQARFDAKQKRRAS